MAAKTQHDRALKAFGQSYAAEAWGVYATQLETMARQTRLLEFQARERGAIKIAEVLEQNAFQLEWLLETWHSLMADIIGSF